VLVAALQHTPEYCRLTRIIRDIPSTDIVVGNQLTNFRQIAEDALRAQGGQSGDIRLREVRQQAIDPATLHLDELHYAGGVSEEVFLQFIDPRRQIAAFLRLSLPQAGLPALHPELEGAAIIREVHVYGQSLGIGQEAQGQAQHSGLGTRLIARAVELARAAGYPRLAVISAVGTRAYYRKRGFADATLYQIRALHTPGE